MSIAIINILNMASAAIAIHRLTSLARFEGPKRHFSEWIVYDFLPQFLLLDMIWIENKQATKFVSAT